MPVHFTCPHCGQLLSVTRRKIGQPVQCVRCQGGVLVPHPAESDAPSDLGGQPQPGSSGPEVPHGSPDKVSSSPVSAMPVTASVQPSYHAGAVEITRAALYTLGGLIAGVAIISFLLGWSFGSEMRANQQSASVSATRHLSGQISYATKRGQTAFDSEAVVIALPTKRKPDEKFESAGLRPDVAPSMVPVSVVQAIRSLGGDFSRTDRNGAYELELSQPGEFYLLVMSNHVSRPPERQPTTREIVEMGQFVTRATELLSNNDYIWLKQMVAKSQEFNHVFGVE